VGTQISVEQTPSNCRVDVKMQVLGNHHTNGDNRQKCHNIAVN